jgi:hypothetical protein
VDPNVSEEKALPHVFSVSVTNLDPVDVAKRCLGSYKQRPGLHFPAHIESPGGMWWKERNDTETDVCIRSTVLMVLEDRFCYDENRQWSYPLSPWAMLTVPDVLYFRDAQGTPYTSKDVLWMPTFVSGIRATPSCRADGSLRPCDLRMISAVYQGVLQAAHVKALDAVILYGLVGVDDQYGYPVRDALLGLNDALISSRRGPKSVILAVPNWSADQQDEAMRILKAQRF